MKKLFGIFVMLFALVGISFATSPYKMITLYPGWNVVSTPSILSGIVFSNGGEGISFSKLSNGGWVSVAATAENIRPLDGFMVYNNNSESITMVLQYKNIAPTETLLQRNLNYGWDFLGIVTTTSPFSNIGDAAIMSVDFTNNGTTNNYNKVNTNYVWNSTSGSVNNPELGEAYGIFINQENAVYGAINNGGVEISDCSGTCESLDIIPNSPHIVLKKASNTTLADFYIRPSDDSCLTLNNLSISISGVTLDKIELLFDGTRGEIESTIGTTEATYRPVLNPPVNEVRVKVNLTEELIGEVELRVTALNGNSKNIIFKNRFEPVLVTFDSQEDKDGSTRFVLGVDKSNSEEVSNVKLYADYTSKLCSTPINIGLNEYCLIYDGTSSITDGDDIEVVNSYDGGIAYFVTAIQYTVSNSDAVGNGVKTIKKVDYNDYFKIGSESVKVYKNS